MKYTCILLFLLLFFIGATVYSQILPAPDIYLVTVSIESQFDSIVWYSIPIGSNTGLLY